MDYNQILACLSAASFHFAGGCVYGFPMIFIPQILYSTIDIHVTFEDITWITGITNMVAPVGALFAGYLADRVGRLLTLKLAALPYIVGWICLATAQNLTALLIGRSMTVFALALAELPSFVYITEVARPDLRGALSCLTVSLTTLGAVVMYIKGAFLSWRTISWLSATYCLPPLLFMSLWSPESPVWLVSQVRTQDARNSLNYLCREDKKAGSAEQKLADLIEVHNSKQGQGDQKGFLLCKLLQALTTAIALKPLLLITGIFILQQFSGIYYPMFHSPTFFEDLGVSMDYQTRTAIIAGGRLIMGLVFSVILLYFGRRPLLIFSYSIMALSIFISGYLSKDIIEGRMEKNGMPVIFIMVYLIVGGMGIIAIPWTLIAEFFPIEIRGMAQGLVVAISNLIMLGGFHVYDMYVYDTLGGTYTTQWMFSGLSLSAAIFIFVFLPETHRKELSEIQEYFSNNTVYILRSPSKPNKYQEGGISLEECSNNQ